MPKRKRSNFERRVAKSLTDRGITYRYESESFEYHLRVYKPLCMSCGDTDVVSIRSYTPDFYLPDSDIFVETKGKFTAPDRQKMINVKKRNPGLDLRLVFMNDNKLSKASKTRYSDWAEKNGFLYAIGDIPDEWV